MAAQTVFFWSLGNLTAKTNNFVTQYTKNNPNVFFSWSACLKASDLIFFILGRDMVNAKYVWYIVRVPWTEKRTNLSVLEDVKSKRSLEATILRLKLRNFGHVMRAKRSPERDIMLGQVEGHRKQVKPRMRWLDSIKEATGLPRPRKGSEYRTHKCEVNSGEGNGKPLLYS